MNKSRYQIIWMVSLVPLTLLGRTNGKIEISASPSPVNREANLIPSPTSTQTRVPVEQYPNGLTFQKKYRA